MAAGGSTKVVLYALGANSGIAISKFVGAYITGSASLLAEAIHSVADCLNQVFLLIGGKRSQLPPSEKFPLGHGREAFFWSFIVAIFLFSVGGLFAIYEGIHRYHEGSVESPIVGFCILAVAVGLEAFSFWACIKEIQKINKYQNLWQWVRRTSASELVVVFMEDLAALLGLAVALTALTLSWILNDARYDAAGSIVVGLILVSIAWLMGVEIKSLIIGEAPETNYRPTLEGLIDRHLSGATLIRLLALQTGSHEVMIACKVRPKVSDDIFSFIEKTNQIERELKAQHPEIKWSFLEADTAD